MKKIIVLTILILASCAQLQHGQEQPVITKSFKDKIFFTSCAGAVEDWPNCYEKATRTCGSNYIVLNKGDDSRGTRRDLTFQCKNAHN